MIEERFFEGLTPTEIARKYGLKHSTVYRDLNRAVAALKEVLFRATNTHS